MARAEFGGQVVLPYADNEAWSSDVTRHVNLLRGRGSIVHLEDDKKVPHLQNPIVLRPKQRYAQTDTSDPFVIFMDSLIHAFNLKASVLGNLH